MKRDPVDLAEIAYDSPVDREEIATVKANFASDELTFEEQKRAAAAAYSERFIGASTLWALRGVK